MQSRCALSLALCLAALVASAVAAAANAKPSVLVVLEDNTLRATHSLYFQALEKAFDLHFKLASDKDLELVSYGKFLYDNLILFTPSIESFGGKMETAHVLKFLDAGHNVVLAADADLTDPLRTIADGCGVEFDEEGTKVIDHLAFDESDADHTLLVADAPALKTILGERPIAAPVLFRGVGHTLRNTQAENAGLVHTLLRGSATSYSAIPDEALRGKSRIAGASTGLVSVLQARNNARALVSGSLELFGNEFFTASVSRQGKKWEKSGNAQFAIEATQWTFQQRGILRAGNATHFRIGENTKPAHYRIKDTIEYHLDIEEWDGSRWAPFRADDVQLEITMLDPYIRSTLKHDNKGHFTTTIQLPDVYGVFTFLVSYHRLGFSNIEARDTVTIRPFRHNEYERFIVSAYPYYAGAFSMLFGFVAFSFLFLWYREPAPAAKKTQ